MYNAHLSLWGYKRLDDVLSTFSIVSEFRSSLKNLCSGGQFRFFAMPLLYQLTRRDTQACEAEQKADVITRLPKSERHRPTEGPFLFLELLTAKFWEQRTHIIDR